MKMWLKYIVLLFLVVSAAGFQAGNFNPDIVPCELLTKKQIETVLPGTDDGYTALSGGSLMKGVDSYQCSYANENMDILTVIVHVAADEDNFSWIKPHSSSIKTEVKVGEGGWLYIQPDELRLEASKGLKVIELNLLASNAKDKKDALIKLATILIDKI